MDRKCMCIAICVMIVVGAALNICGQALDQELKIAQQAKVPNVKKMEELTRGSMWCINLSYLMGAVSLLLILCCLCCRDVDFGGKGSKDDYE